MRLSRPLNAKSPGNPSTRLLSLLFFAVAAVCVLAFATNAQAAWPTGGQLASGSLSGSPFQSSTGVAAPIISDDGRYEFFASRSSSLSGSAPNGGIFRKDLQNDAAPLDVVVAQPAGVTNANCGIPISQGSYISSSSNGRYLAFSTSQDGLVPADTNGRRDVYVRDMNTAIGSGAFELASATNASSNAPAYTLTDLGSGTSIPVPATDDCLYGSELTGPNSISNDGKKVVFSNTAFTSISAAHGTTTGPGNIWVRTLGTTNTELVTKVVNNYDSSPNATVGAPLPDPSKYDTDVNNIARLKPLASISGDGSAVAWDGAFARYQTTYHRAESTTGAPGDFQSFTYLYRRIADGVNAKTRRAITWADPDDSSCDPNLVIDFGVDPDPGSAATYNKRLACVGRFGGEGSSRNDVRVPALSDDGRKVFALVGQPGRFLTEILNTYPLDLVVSDMAPGVSRKVGTQWITRANLATSGQALTDFAVSGDGTRAAILTTRRDFSNSGLVQTGTFPATANSDAVFVINGTSGVVSGENGWSGAPIEWAARPTAGTTDPAPGTFLPSLSLSRTGNTLAFGSKDPAFYAGANGQYQALCIKDGSTCPTAPAASAPAVTIGAPSNGAQLSGDVGASFAAAGATSVTCQWDAEAVLSPCPSSPLSLKTLGAGSHTFSVTGTNATGSTTAVSSFTIGAAPAAATINSPASGAATASPVIPTYSVTGTPDRVNCWYDATAWVTTSSSNFNCPTVLPSKTLTAGTHTFNVMTSNAFGSTTTTRSFFVTTQTPVLTVTNPLDGGIYKNTISATFTATNSPTGFTCKIDTAAAAACTSPKSLGTLAGTTGTAHTVTFTATNAGGTATVVRNFTVINTAPTVTINSPATGATGVGSPVTALFTLGGGAASSVTCQWDAEAVISNCTQAGIAGKVFATGSHSLTVIATNAQGSATATSTFSVTASAPAAPTVTIDSPTEGQSVPSPVSPTFTLGGGAATSVTCQFDSAAVINSCTPAAIANTVLTTGAHALTVTATNTGGTGTATRNFTITAPLAPPSVTIGSPANGATGVVSPVTASFTLGGGAASSITCQWDSETVITSCTSPQGPKVLTPGAHTFKVTATNGSGSDTKTSGFDVLDVPSITVGAPTEGQTVVSPVTASFTLGGGAASSVTCQWDAETVITSCTSPQGPKVLTPGAHTFKVTATNAAGSTSLTRNFIVLAPPTVVSITPANGATGLVSPVSGSFTLGGGAATSVTCQWDAEAVINSCTPALLANKVLTPATHTLKVTATNAAGSDTKTNSFTVIDAPVVSIGSPTEGQTVTSPVTASFSLKGGAATSVTCQWDAETVITSCTSPQGPKTLAPGAHTFKVIATNAAGSSTVTRNFTVLAPPTVSITNPVDGSTGVVTPVSGTFTLGGGAATSVTCQWDSETVITSCTTASLASKSFSPGGHLLTVIAINAAGSGQDTSNFTIGSAPGLTIDTPTEGQTVVSPVSPIFTATGATSISCQWDSEAVINSCTQAGLAAKSLTPGAHALKIIATNIHGSTTVTRNFTVLAPPTVVSITPANGATGLVSPMSGSFTLGGGAATSVSCQWDSEAVINSCTPASLANKLLTPATHTLKVTATNAAGSDTKTNSFTVIDAPVVAISAPTQGQTVVSPVTASFTLSGGAATSVTCQWDAEAVITSCTSPQGPKVLTPGAHTLIVTASNAAGSSSVTRNFTVLAPPTVSITNPVDGTNGVVSPVSGTFTLGGGAASSVTCQWDAEAVINSCTPASLAGKALGAGGHILKVTATNAAGSGQDTSNFTIGSAPGLTIDTPNEGQIVVSPVSPTFTATGATGVSCQWDSEAVINSCTEGVLAAKTLTPGSHSLKITATNTHGSTIVTRNFSVLAPPTVTVVAPTEGQTTTSPVTASFTLGGGAASSVTCQWDSETVLTSCTSPQGPKTLTAGAHSFKVIATNAAGSATATRNFSVIAEPIVQSITPADGATGVASPVTASFTLGGGPASTVSCQWDEESDIAPCTSPLAPKVLTPGTHSLTVTASNDAGVDTVTSTFTVLEAPTVSIGSPTAGQTVGSPVTASFTLGGGAAGNVTCQWDAEATISSCASPQGPKTLAPGTHTFKVTATNAVGSDSVTRSFIVGQVPGITISTPADGSTLGSPVNASYSVTNATSVACKWDSEATITPCPASPAPKALAPGVHKFRVTATNVAGTSTLENTFTVVAPPTVTITTPPDGSVQTSPVGASFTLGGGAAASVTCQWDSEAVISSCTSPVGAHALAGGAHVFRVTAANAGGTVTATSNFTVPTGDFLKVGAVTVIANFPHNCQLTGGDFNNAPYARFRLSNSTLEKALSGDPAFDQWGEILPAIEATPLNLAGRTTASCRAVKVRRVVRPDSSGETLALKQLLDGINPATGWGSTYAGTTWPHAATIVTASAPGAEALAAKVRATQNSIGYADLEAARAGSFRKLAESSSTINSAAYQYTNDNDSAAFPAINWTYTYRKSLFWIPLESLSTPGTYVEPTALPSDIRNSRRRGSNCPGSPVDDWSIVTGTTIPASAYPLCVAEEVTP